MQNILTQSKNRSLLILTISIGMLALSYLLLYQVGIIDSFPQNTNMVNWDAVFYQQIRDHGYVYIPDKPSNMAFFPLFPWLWKWSYLPPLGICLLNMVLYYSSLFFLIGKRSPGGLFLLTLVTLPCFIFFNLPYSESLFFFFGTLALNGYRRDQHWLIAVGILGCCLTRAVAMVFIPVIIITEFLYHKNERGRMDTRPLMYLLLALIAVLVVGVVQGYQTGKWFHFMQAAKDFNRGFLFPSLPFTTISAAKVLGTDSLSWGVGLIAAGFCIRWGLIKLRTYLVKEKQARLDVTATDTDRSVYFSALFLSAVFVIDTFFTNNINGHTNIWSINRHLLCTPFAINFLLALRYDIERSRTDHFWIIPLLIMGILLTGLFQYPLHLFYYVILGSVLMFRRIFGIEKYLLIPALLLNLFFYTIYLHDYILIKWVG